MDMNPFGIGPAGAVFLTVFVCLTVMAAAGIWCYATYLCVSRICDCVVSVWGEAEQMIRDLNNAPRTVRIRENKP